MELNKLNSMEITEQPIKNDPELGNSNGITEQSTKNDIELDKITQFIVVRKDLKMTHGKMAAQVAHASLASVLPNQNDPFVQKWLSGSFTKVVLGVKNYYQLLKVCETLRDNGIIHSEIWDNCLTELIRETESGTLTCIGLKPMPKSQLQPYLRKLQLYV